MRVRRRLIRKPRDAEQRRLEAKRFSARLSMGIVVVGAIVGLVVVANRWEARESLRGVRIVGRVVLDSAEIMERAGIDSSALLHDLDLSAIEERIASNPFLSRAAVYRGTNGTLVVEVGERTPVAMTSIGGSAVYLDSQGVILPYRFSSATFDVPVISGIEALPDSGAGRAVRSSVAADTLAPKRLAGSAAKIDSLHAVEALGVVRTLRDFDESLYRQVSEVRRESGGEYTLLSADGAVPIRIGLPSDVRARLGKLDRFWRTVLAARGASRARYVDLRWDGQVVVRWRDEVVTGGS